MELPKLLPDLPDMTKTSMGEKRKAKHLKGYKPEDSSDCTIAKCMDCAYLNDEHWGNIIITQNKYTGLSIIRYDRNDGHIWERRTQERNWA